MEPCLKAARRALWCLVPWEGSRAEPAPSALQELVTEREEVRSFRFAVWTTALSDHGPQPLWTQAE